VSFCIDNPLARLGLIVYTIRMKIVVDEPKRLANLDKHGIDQNDVEAGFEFGAAIRFPTRPSRTGRARYLAVGPMAGHGLVTIVFSPLGNEAIGLVSVRPANRSEREAYGQ